MIGMFADASHGPQGENHPDAASRDSGGGGRGG